MIDSTVVAKIATMNTELLKELSLEEVLGFHPLLDAQSLSFGKARKVKPIKARPINTILDKNDLGVFEKMLLSTLEGAQTLKRDAFICWGVDNDVWQQDKKKLHAKYNPTEMDEDGWVTFVPKEGDDAVMNACQITEAIAQLGPCGGWSINNPWWGDERVIPSLGKAYLHYGIAGDWVMQNQKDKTDVYRISSKFFNSTYE